LLIGPSWPIFTCPNCRAAADLDADVEEPTGDWEQYDEDEDSMEEKPDDAAAPKEGDDAPANESAAAEAPRQSETQDEAGVENGDPTVMMDSTMVAEAASSVNATSDPVAIPNATPRHNPTLDTSSRGLRTPSPADAPLVPSNEGPITPRNDAGPWVFDGDAGRSSQDVSRRPGLTSLDAAAQNGSNGT
jgi:E3 ubiquitin-protein ligase DMA1/2